jgi:hypothetical protein
MAEEAAMVATSQEQAIQNSGTSYFAGGGET